MSVEEKRTAPTKRWAGVGVRRLLSGDIARRVGGNTAHLFVLRAVGMGLLFLMHAVLARRLGAAGYGIVSYALSVAGLGALVVTLGMPNGVLRFAAQYLDGGRWAELKGILVRSLQIILVCSVGGSVVLALLGLVPALGSEMRRCLLYAALALPLIALGLWRTKTARALGGLSTAFFPEEVLLPTLVMGLVLVLPAVHPGSAIVSYLAGSLCAALVGMIWLVRLVPLQARRTTAKMQTRLWLSVSLPMTVASVTQLSLNRTDALFMGALTSMEETGLYIAVSRIAVLATLALRIVDSAVAPMLSAAFHGGRMGEFRAIFGLGVGISILGGLPLLLIALLAPQQLLRIFGGEFLQGVAILRVLVVGHAVNAATGPVAFLFLMTGREKLYAKAIGASALVSAVAHALIIPRWGGLGAAWVTAVNVALLNLGLLGFGVRRILATDAET